MWGLGFESVGSGVMEFRGSQLGFGSLVFRDQGLGL